MFAINAENLKNLRCYILYYENIKLLKYYNMKKDLKKNSQLKH